jgi:hypothetical protein
MNSRAPTYFLSPACQLSTTVNGGGVFSMVNRNR